MLGEGRCGVRIDGEHEEWAAVYSVRSSEPSSGKALQGSALCRWQECLHQRMIRERATER